MMGYTNKAHDGYLGDSYVGKWVNLGAGTTTSNLKNTYGEITMDMGSEKVPTGRRRLGALIGDHTKTAILTRLTAGTYVGFCSMLADSGVAAAVRAELHVLDRQGAGAVPAGQGDRGDPARVRAAATAGGPKPTRTIMQLRRRGARRRSRGRSKPTGPRSLRGRKTA